MKLIGTHRARSARVLVLGVATTVAALGMVGVAPAASAAVSGDWAYEVSGDSATITAWAGNCNDHPDLWAGTPPCAVIASGGTLTIPSTLGGKPVTGIGQGAIQASDANGGRGAVGLVIPSTVTSIGASALTQFYGVTALDLPANLQSIGGDGLSYLGSNAGHPLVVLPASVTQLGGDALFRVNVDASAALPNLTSVGAYVFKDTYNYSLGATVVNLSHILTLGPWAFKQTGITSLTLGSGLTDMYDWGYGGQFRDNQISSIVIPGSVQSIPQYAFYNNPLTSVVINNGVGAIGEYAFSKSVSAHAITSLSIPSTITTIGSHAFDGALSNSITSLTFPAGLSEIGEYAFANNNLETLTIPASVRTIGTSAFAKMGPQTITYVAPVFTGLTPTSATVGSAYTTTFAASGASLAVKSGDALPDGLTLDSNTGVLAGTPTTAGTYTFRLVATNADPASTTNASSPSNSSPYTSSPVTITINGAAPSPSPSGDSGGSGASSPSATPTPTPTPSASASVTPTVTPSASPSSSVVAPVGVVLLSQAEVAKAEVITVSTPLSSNPVNAPVLSIPAGTPVAPVVSGLPTNTPLRVKMSAPVRAKEAFVNIGNTRSNAAGKAKVPAFKASRAGTYTIQLSTAAGKAFYLKVKVAPKKSSSASGSSAKASGKSSR